MGCLLASRLQLTACRVALILRDKTQAAVTTVTVEHGDSSTDFSFAATVPADREPISHLLITTKAQDIIAATEGIAHRLDTHTQVLVLSNGMGYAKDLIAMLPGSSCFFGTTTEGAYRLGSRHIYHAGKGITRIGRAGTSDPPDWFRFWDTAMTSEWSTSIDNILWHKFAINCAINPITAVHGCLNGELMAPDRWSEVELVCSEIKAVCAKERMTHALGDLLGEVKQVVAATANNRSSMLQDVLSGRSTEIQYLTGYLLRLADLHGLTLPANTSLYERVLKLNN